MTEEIFYVEPTKIKVREGLDRYRRDLGDLTEFGKSLKEHGQIQPIVINRQNELIVGGRRLAACTIMGMKVKVIYEDMVDPVKMRTWELEENLRRKELTPAEYALAVEELHALMREQKGEAVSGREGGHSLEDTAKILGKTKGSVISELEMAAMIKAFPELRTAKKKNEIKSAAKGLMKLNAAMEGLKGLEAASKKGNELFQLHRMDATEHMKSLPDGCKDILLTDPPYGVGMDKLEQTAGGKTGGLLTTTGIKLDDDTATTLVILKTLATESFRFTKSNAHGYVFVGPEHFHFLRQVFMKAGWRVHVKPLIWIKREVGQCNVPSAWPASCYEMLMYLRKDDSRIIKEGQPDWIECNPVLPSERIHPYEKPMPLLLNLLERVCLPGQQLYDPFAGSSSSLEAGMRMNMICEGIENSLEAYAVAMSRLNNYLKERDA